MPQSQNDFIARKENSDNPTDARQFLTWYHPEDIHRIAQQTYNNQPKSTKHQIHAPIMVLGSYAHSFEEKMRFCSAQLNESDKQILPFIIAPEMGAAHFMAGFIRRGQDEQFYDDIFLFNPTGYTRERAVKRLALDDIEDVASMEMHVSQLQVQTIDKDQLEGNKGPALVSCGPIALFFIEYLLANPNYGLELDEHFALPERIIELEAMSKEAYQKHILAQRQNHYDLLGTIADKELESIDTSNYQMVAKFLDGDWKEESSWEESYDSDLFIESDNMVMESPLVKEKSASPSPSTFDKVVQSSVAQVPPKYDNRLTPIKANHSDEQEQLISTSIAENNYLTRANHYQKLAENSDDTVLKELYTQAKRINQRACSPGIFNLLGALLSYNSHKVSFTDKATHLNQAIDELGIINSKNLKLKFKVQSSNLYLALNETTMSHVDKTTAVQKIELSLEQEKTNVQFIV